MKVTRDALNEVRVDIEKDEQEKALDEFFGPYGWRNVEHPWWPTDQDEPSEYELRAKKG